MTKVEELKAKIESLKAKAQTAIDSGDAKEAKEFMNSLSETKDLLNVALDLESQEKQELETKAKNSPDQTDKKAKAIKDFASAARRGFKATMTEGSNSDGGYTVPKDISTMINAYKEAKFSALSLVEVVPVSTNSGQRTFKKRQQQTGFTLVGEGGKLGKKATPQFERQLYEIKKYGGWYPITNELLADSDQNITNTLVKFIGDESRITANKLIFAKVKELTEVEFKGLDDIKKALNVTLGQAFKPTSKIITNDDGLQYLDTLKDSDGKYLLQSNPTDPMQMRLCAGATTIQVVVIPNADLATTDSKIPFIVGDLKEAVTFFDRQKLSIMSSNIAVAGELNAFEEDLTLFRPIEREDVQLKDTAAVVNGFITVISE